MGNDAHSDTDGLLTVADFMRVYAVSRTTLYRLVAARKLRLVKIGRASRIPRADARAWASNLPSLKEEYNS